MSAAKEIAEYFKMIERIRGPIVDEFEHPFTKEIVDNGTTIPVKLLRQLVAELEEIES